MQVAHTRGRRRRQLSHLHVRGSHRRASDSQLVGFNGSMSLYIPHRECSFAGLTKKIGLRNYSLLVLEDRSTESLAGGPGRNQWYRYGELSRYHKEWSSRRVTRGHNWQQACGGRDVVDAGWDRERRDTFLALLDPTV